MKIGAKCTVFLVMVVFFGAMIPRAVSGEEAKAQLRIATILGTEATISYDRFTTDDEKMSKVMEGNLLLRD